MSKRSRLSLRQREFLTALRAEHLEDCPGMWTEVFPHEERTARSLAARGLVEVQEAGVSALEARLTAPPSSTSQPSRPSTRRRKSMGERKPFVPIQVPAWKPRRPTDRELAAFIAEGEDATRSLVVEDRHFGRTDSRVVMWLAYEEQRRRAHPAEPSLDTPEGGSE